MKISVTILLLCICFSTLAKVNHKNKQRADSLYAVAMDENQPKEVRIKSFRSIRKRVYVDLPRGTQMVRSFLSYAEEINDSVQQITALHSLGYSNLMVGKPDSALIQYKRALKMALLLKRYSDITYQYTNVGNTYLTMGILDSAYFYNHQGLLIAQKHGIIRTQARAYINIGEVYFLRGDYNQSITHYKTALAFCEQRKFYGYYPAIYMAMGDVYKEIGEFKTADQYYRKSLKSATSNNRFARQVESYVKLAELSFVQDNYSLAFSEYKMGETIAFENNLPIEMIRVKKGVAELLYAMKKYDDALIEINHVLKLMEEISIVYGIDKSYNIKAKIYQQQGERDLSKQFLKKAYTLAKEKGSSELMDICYNKFVLYKDLGNNALALKYFEEYTLLKDQQDNKTATKELIKIEYQRKHVQDSLLHFTEMEKKKLKFNQELEKRQSRMYMAYVSITILILVLLVFGYLWRSKNKLNRQLELKNKEVEQSLKDKGVLLKELHHRVKNNMQVVSSVLQLKAKNTEDKATKEALMESQLRLQSIQIAHQKIFDSNDYDQVDLIQYSKELSEVLKSSIFEHSCNIEIKGSSLYINIEQAQAVGYILHELITNSAKHAWDSAKNKKIMITISLANENVHLTYQDNGNGLPAYFKLSEAKSFGVKFIYSLVKRQLRGEVNYRNDNGARFQIKFKKR